MSKSRDIADSAATINFIDTVTSNVQDQIDNIDPLPSQTGNNGLFLTTDGTDASWAAAGGGAWELISSVTATNVAAASFTSLSGYNAYMIVGYEMRPANDNKQLCVRVSTSSSFQSTTDYSSRHLFCSAHTSATRNSDGPRDKMNLTPSGRRDNTTYSGDIILYIHNLHESISTSMNWRGSYVRQYQTIRDLHIGQGDFFTASANDGIQIIEEDGNNLYGTFYLYGLKTS